MQHEFDRVESTTPRHPPPVELSVAVATSQQIGVAEDPDESPTTQTVEASHPGGVVDAPAVSSVFVTGDRVTLAQGAPAMFNLKPGRQGVVVAVSTKPDD